MTNESGDSMTRCGVCTAEKSSYGTSVLLCPECDFAHCRNPECRKTIHQLTWNACPHCGERG